MPICIPCGFIEKADGPKLTKEHRRTVGGARAPFTDHFWLLLLAALAVSGSTSVAGQEAQSGTGVSTKPPAAGLFGPVPDSKTPVKPDTTPPPDLSPGVAPEPKTGARLFTPGATPLFTPGATPTSPPGVMTLPGVTPPPGSVTGTVDGRESQFTVEGEDRITRSATASFAESLAADFRRLFHIEKWHHRIQVKMRGTLQDVLAGPETARQIIVGPDGKLILFLHVKLSERFRKETLTQEILRLLLLDQMLVGRENDPILEKRRPEEPAWLLYGAGELMRFRSQGRPSETFAGLIKSRQFLPTGKILSGLPEGSDSIAKAVWVASSTAMVASLLAQPEAATGFRDYLGDYLDLPDGGGGEADTALLRQHFPALRSSQVSLDKWWALELATMGDRHLMEFLSVAQTETALDAALAIRLDPPQSEPGKSRAGAIVWLKKWVPSTKRQAEFHKKGYDGRLHDIDGYAGLAGDDQAVENCLIRLTNLRQHCFPVYRPLLDRYIEGAKNLLEGHWEGVAESLAAADVDRQQMKEILRQVEDAMNYEEATRAPVDEEFRDYDAAVERLKHLPRIQRSDPISKYLDAYEREMLSQ